MQARWRSRRGCKLLWPFACPARSKMSSVDVYLMKNVGLFPDVFERLAMRHYEKGDHISALVTGEYYASKKHFPGFGRPCVFNAELMLKVGRKLEAKDAARCALRSPWWTLGASYADVVSLSEVCVDQATFLLDLAAVECTWDDVREQLASFYTEAGLPEFATFITTA